MYIVYKSHNGSIARYARLLYYETDLPVYSIEEAKSKLPDLTEIIYLGWSRAGNIKGYKRAAKRYRIYAVCAVGMGRIDTQTENIRRKNGISENIPLFTLQGDFYGKQRVRPENLDAVVDWYYAWYKRNGRRKQNENFNKNPKDLSCI